MKPDFFNAIPWPQIFYQAVTLFVVLDSLGNIGIVIALLRPYEVKRQKAILHRELVISLMVMLVFYFFGQAFLSTLHISQAAVQITGAAVLFFFALSLLFPKPTNDTEQIFQEPFIVPIAVPLISGPSCLAIIMLLPHDVTGTTVSLTAIALAWTATAGVFLMAPLLTRILGATGISVTERIMGLICAILAINMLLKGIETYLLQGALVRHL